MHDLPPSSSQNFQESVPTKDARLGLVGISTGMCGFPSCMVAGWGVQTIAPVQSWSSHRWSRSNDYNVAEQFVWGLTVVNDGAERCVCTITDFAQATGDSIYQENILLIGNAHQEVFQDLQKAGPCQAINLRHLKWTFNLVLLMCHCIMELHVFVTNDRLYNMGM